MLDRRSIIKRAIGAVGVAVLTQKLPLGVKLLTPEELQAADTYTDNLLVINNCIIHNGDPSWNPIDLIEEAEWGCAIVNKEFFINKELNLGTRPLQLALHNCTFNNVRLSLSSEVRHSSITNCTFDLIACASDSDSVMFSPIRVAA